MVIANYFQQSSISEVYSQNFTRVKILFQFRPYLLSVR
jgi:hypothetical protein